MAMSFLRQRFTSVSGRLLLVLVLVPGVAVLPLLLFVLASAHLQPGLRQAAASAASLAATPGLQSLQLATPDAERRAVDGARGEGSFDGGPLALNPASVLALAALGLAAAWVLGRQLLRLPAPGMAPPGFRSAVAAAASGRLAADAPGMALFHQLADALPQMVSILQADGSSSYINHRWADFVGLPPDEILEHRWNRFVHPDDLPKISAVWADAAGRGAPVEFEYRLLRADGCFRWMLGRAVALAAQGAQGSQGARAAEWLITSTDIDDLKQSAVLLEKALSLKRLVGRMAKVGAWTITLPDRTLTWSPENCLIHDVPEGYQPTLGEGIGYFLPEHRSLVTGCVEACIAHGMPYDFVLPKHTAKQRLIWVRSIGEAVRNDAGQIIGLQGAFQDVTAQKEAEQRTHALDVQLTTTMDGITDGFYVLNSDWAFTYANASAERMFKRSRSDLIGHTVWELFPEKLGTSIEMEFRLTTGDQKTRHFEAFYPPLATWFDVHSYPLGDGVAVYLRDVTQTRADRAQLRLLQTAVARLNDTVVIAHASPVSGAPMPVVFVNEAFERCTGFQPSDLMGQDFAAQFSTRLPPTEWARVSGAMAQYQPVRTELALTSKAGAALWLEVDVTPIADDHGTFTHWVAVKRDMTERRQHQQQILLLNSELEARVKRRTAQLESANKELESFAYAVSHDLRSPLNTIAGFMPLLVRAESDQLSEKGRHYLARIGAGVTQMGQLISGLLTLAHMSREQPQLDVLDLTAISEKTASTLRENYPERTVQITIDAGLSVQGDPRLVSAALEQLIDNAWKFSSPRADAQIHIGSQSGSSGELVFFVRDNGVGFDMAYEQKLFGTFERLHSPGEFEGIGIGLATVKRVIDNHGGRIWAESTVGGGATFFFTLGVGLHGGERQTA